MFLQTHRVNFWRARTKFRAKNYNSFRALSEKSQKNNMLKMKFLKKFLRGRRMSFGQPADFFSASSKNTTIVSNWILIYCLSRTFFSRKIPLDMQMENLTNSPTINSPKIWKHSAHSLKKKQTFIVFFKMRFFLKHLLRVITMQFWETCRHFTAGKKPDFLTQNSEITLSFLFREKIAPGKSSSGNVAGSFDGIG